MPRVPQSFGQRAQDEEIDRINRRLVVLEALPAAKPVPAVQQLSGPFQGLFIGESIQGAAALGVLLVDGSGNLGEDAAHLSYDATTLYLTLGGGLVVHEGTNARMGVSDLVGGTVTVANTSVTANTRIFLSHQGGGPTPAALYVSARVAGTSFTITSILMTDTGSVAWLLIEPGA